MTSKALNFIMIIAVAAVTLSCGKSKKEKELQARIAELEQQVAKADPTPVSTNTTAAEPETAPEGPVPVFEFSEELHDFGTITEGDVVEHIFTFTNTGEAPLIISSAKGSCGCTVPEWPKEPVGIGEEGTIKVKFNSSKKPGIQNKTVTITANTYPKVSRLRIKANVTKVDEPS